MEKSLAPINSDQLFDVCYYINLDRNTERRDRFLANVKEVADWPFNKPIRWPGVDCDPPKWFVSGKGAWGCLLAHLEIYHHCLIHGIGSVMIFEDDAVFCDDLGNKVREFVRNVPDDWNQMYFGGNHYAMPKAINEHVLQARICNTTHAYAIRSTALSAVHQYLSKYPAALETDNCHIDCIFGYLHSRGIMKAYTPWRFLVGQSSARSDRTGKYPEWTEDQYFDLPNEARERLARDVK